MDNCEASLDVGEELFQNGIDVLRIPTTAVDSSKEKLRNVRGLGVSESQNNMVHVPQVMPSSIFQARNL